MKKRFLRPKSSLRLLRMSLVFLGLVLSRPYPAGALINLTYTPVNLVRNSTAIARVEVGPVTEAGQCPATVLRLLKGDVPRKMVLQTAFREPEAREAWGKAFGEGKSARALFFRARFRGVKDDAGGEATPAKCVGALLVGLTWFVVLEGEGERLGLGNDPLDMKSVWAGGDETLERLIDAIQDDPSTKVPVTAGPGWNLQTRIAQLDGFVYACSAVELLPDANPCLFVACDRGDRVFQQAKDGDDFLDLTPRLKVSSKSRLAAWADFNGDARLDLASWDGRMLHVYEQAEDGTLAVATTELDIGADCQRLVPLDVGQNGRAGLLIGAGHAPTLLVPDAGGKLQSKPLPAAPRELLAKLGPPGPCVPADFDGDGRVDLVQTFAKGVLLYRGRGRGEFADPVLALRTGLGSQITDAFAGDFDADGLPDLCVTSDVGCALLINCGGKEFVQKQAESGEFAYISKPDAFAGAVCDVNLDGREDILLLYPQMKPLVFFNRGFRCFGHAVTLDLDSCSLGCRDAIAQGQQAGTIAALGRDGQPCLVVATPEGELWQLTRAPRKERPLGLTVAVPNRVAGPVRVVAYDGKRCLGARGVAAGAPVFFPKAEKGPMKLGWQVPGGPPRTKEFTILDATRFVLPIE